MKKLTYWLASIFCNRLLQYNLTISNVLIVGESVLMSTNFSFSRFQNPLYRIAIASKSYFVPLREDKKKAKKFTKILSQPSRATEASLDVSSNAIKLPINTAEYSLESLQQNGRSNKSQPTASIYGLYAPNSFFHLLAPSDDKNSATVCRRPLTPCERFEVINADESKDRFLESRLQCEYPCRLLCNDRPESLMTCMVTHAPGCRLHSRRASPPYPCECMNYKALLPDIFRLEDCRLSCKDCKRLGIPDCMETYFSDLCQSKL